MGRGASGIAGGGLSPVALYENAKQNYTVNYTPFMRGQISRTDAGQIYKANKNGNINVPKSFISELYDQTKLDWRGAIHRYSGLDAFFYDRVHNATHALLNNDYKTAQVLIDDAIQIWNRER